MFPAGFEWDLVTAASNADKHGVRFAVAVEVFADPDYLEFEDHVRNGEVRTDIIGQVRGVVLFMTFTRRGANVRMISARSGDGGSAMPITSEQAASLAVHVRDTDGFSTEARRRLDAMTDAEIEQAARKDSDAEPASASVLKRAVEKRRQRQGLAKTVARCARSKGGEQP